MKTNKTTYEDLMKQVYTVNAYDIELSKKIDKSETDKLIKDAIKSSEKQVDAAIRRSEREIRREINNNNNWIRKGLISILLIIISSIIIYLCAGSYDQGVETTFIGINLIINIIIGGFSFANLMYSIYKLDYNEKIKYTVVFTDHSDAIHNYERTYITRMTNPKKAIKRFYKLYNYEEVGNVYIFDEYGNKYDDKGRIVEDK